MFVVALLGVMPATGLARPQGAPLQRPAKTHAAVSQRSLVFVLTTGNEDLQRMSSVFRHALVAAKENRLREIVVLVYGRGLDALDRKNQVRPASLPASVREAQAAGVRVIVCQQAMTKSGLTATDLDPAPTTIVPNAIATLVDYVANDAAVVSY